MIEPIRGSIWKSNVNTFLGTLLLATFALWASLVMWRAAFGENPLANAFSAAIASETQIK